MPDIADASSTSPRPGAPCAPPACRIIDTILVSYTELIANPVAYADPAKRHAMEQLQTLLTGALEARGKVLVKLNVDGADLDARDRAAAVDEVAHGVEALRRRTVTRSRPWCAKREINTLIPALKDAGATGIIELPISKIVH